MFRIHKSHLKNNLTSYVLCNMLYYDKRIISNAKCLEP